MPSKLIRLLSSKKNFIYTSLHFHLVYDHPWTTPKWRRRSSGVKITDSMYFLPHFKDFAHACLTQGLDIFRGKEWQFFFEIPVSYFANGEIRQKKGGNNKTWNFGGKYLYFFTLFLHLYPGLTYQTNRSLAFRWTKIYAHDCIIRRRSFSCIICHFSWLVYIGYLKSISCDF